MEQAKIRPDLLHVIASYRSFRTGPVEPRSCFLRINDSDDGGFVFEEFDGTSALRISKKSVFLVTNAKTGEIIFSNGHV